jgi:hypothetical protein
VRKFNAFNLVNGRIEYTDKIKAAVLDPRLTGLRINLNGGWDWIDSRWGFIKLLLSRGQIAEMWTGSDLLGRTDYFDALALGVFQGVSGQYRFDKIRVNFEIRESVPKKSAYASAKRVEAARERFNQLIQQRGA